jgi:isopenicillin N synthase-like dioxygenase
VFAGDYKEGYYIGVEVSADDPKAEKQFYGQNLWPVAGNSISNLFHKQNNGS